MIHVKLKSLRITFGKEEFEKWLIQDFILTGELNIKSYANKNLKRLDNISKLINMDANYRMLESKYWELFDLSLKDNDKNKYKMEFESIYNDEKRIISNYYSRYKNLENGNEL